MYILYSVNINIINNLNMDVIKKCIPCQGGIPKLNSDEINSYLKKLTKTGKLMMINYTNILIFQNTKSQYILNEVAKIAIEEDHHPFIHINFKTVKIILFTHKINGLHENDFLIA